MIAAMAQLGHMAKDCPRDKQRSSNKGVGFVVTSLLATLRYFKQVAQYDH